MTFLVIPFESNAEKPELHNDVGDWIFNAVCKIIQSKDYGVASPMKKEDLEMLLSKQHGQSTCNTTAGVFLNLTKSQLT